MRTGGRRKSIELELDDNLGDDDGEGKDLDTSLRDFDFGAEFEEDGEVYEDE